MQESLHDYMRVGLVHFMAYPECMGGDGPVMETIRRLVADPYFEVLEITRINDAEQRRQVRECCEQAGVTLGFGAQPILLGGKLDLNHPDAMERERAVAAVTASIDQAAEMGIGRVAVLSGRVSDDKAQAMERLIDSLLVLCDHAATYGIEIVLETFDQVPYGKNCLIGSTRDAVRVSEAVRRRHPSFGLMLDMSHLPLQGEDFATAIAEAGDHLVHAHIGNCAMDDPAHPAYGDNHPRFGAPGTRNGVKELTAFLRVLLDAGYINRDARRIVSFEVKPMAGESSEAVLAGSKRALLEAWRSV
jgi:sugar phosphate isomerase/epimerase